MIKSNYSQNHRMVGVGRDLCGSSSPTPLTKQAHPQQAAQDLVQAGLEYLQRRRLHNLPWQPVPHNLSAQGTTKPTVQTAKVFTSAVTAGIKDLNMAIWTSVNERNLSHFTSK